MSDKHTELELKFEADKVKLDKFLRWGTGKSKRVKEYVRVLDGLDWYYSNDKGNVVRHRVSTNKNELTVKLRKSADNTTDRLEIDLGFDADTLPKDVAAFLQSTGWKLDFILSKDSHIFRIKEYVSADWTPSEYEYTAALYTVHRLGADKLPEKGARSFLEVEIEKGCGLFGVRAIKTLNGLGEEVRKEFGLKKPLNESLYEIYSGKKYLTVERG